MNKKSRLFSSLLFLGLLATHLPAAAAPADTRRVNINTADAAKLALLPRVGPAVAERILDYRKQNGPFKSVEDLMHVRGIGEKTYALLKPYVALSGETSLTEKVHNSRGASGKSAKSDKSEGARH